MAVQPIRGEITVPGDKSISHRALILAAISDGVCKIRNLSPCDDVRATVACLRKLGAKIYLRKNTATVYPIVKANTDVTFHCRNKYRSICTVALAVVYTGIHIAVAYCFLNKSRVKACPYFSTYPCAV